MLVVALLLGLAGGGWAIHKHREHVAAARENDPSYLYGRHIELTVIYDEPFSGSVTQMCKKTLAQKPATFPDFNLALAVRGCTDEESALDS